MTYRGCPIVFLPAPVFDATQRLGYDMNYFQKLEPILMINKTSQFQGDVEPYKR